MNTKKKVVIIGLGNIGQAVAGNLAKSSRSFIVAGRDHAKVEAVATQWGLAVEAAPIDPVGVVLQLGLRGGHGVPAVARQRRGVLDGIGLEEKEVGFGRHLPAVAGQVRDVALAAHGRTRPLVGRCALHSVEELGHARRHGGDGRSFLGLLEQFREHVALAGDVLQMVVDQLPSIVREMAAPLSSIDQMSVVSTDGATPLVKTVASGIGQTTELVKGLTGVDLAGLFHNASTDATNAPDVPGGSAGSSSKA